METSQRVQHIRTNRCGTVLEVIESRSPYNPGEWCNVAYDSGVVALVQSSDLQDATPDRRRDEYAEFAAAETARMHAEINPHPHYPAMKCVYCAIIVTEPDEDHMFHCHDTDGWFMSCGAMGNGGPKACRS